MATYCTIQNTKATITVTKNGKQIKVTSSNPPIDVTCKNNIDPAPCTKVKVTVNYVYTSVGSDNKVVTALAPVEGLKITDNKRILSILCRGLNNETCGARQWRIIADLAGLSYGFASASITKIEPISTTDQPAQKGVIIKDRNGMVIYEDDTADCSVNVVCDDDCPEGTCKCPSPIYPGYCCLDCSATASSIRAITSELRAKNG